MPVYYGNTFNDSALSFEVNILFKHITIWCEIGIINILKTNVLVNVCGAFTNSLKNWEGG